MPRAARIVVTDLSQHVVQRGNRRQQGLVCFGLSPPAHWMVIQAGSINRDHVHMLLSTPPRLSVSRAVQHLKGRSSHKLLNEFASLRRHYWGQHLWARGYWVKSSGNVPDEARAEYIKSQVPPEPDDDSHVT